MNRFLLAIFILFVFYSCEKKQTNYFTLKGEIKGLTKGTLYLEKVRDNKFILVDSFTIANNGKFEMSDSLFSPEVYFFRLKEKPKDEIIFFAEPGIIILNAKLDKLSSSGKISGSKNQELWENYKGIMRKFNDENLDFVKEKLMAEKEKNQFKIDSIENLYKKHLKRKYLYATNFAVKNAANEVAPYIALSDLYDANIYLLDTIEKSMSEKIKTSMYGKKLTKFVNQIKENEKDTLK